MEIIKYEVDILKCTRKSIWMTQNPYNLIPFCSKEIYLKNGNVSRTLTQNGLVWFKLQGKITVHSGDWATPSVQTHENSSLVFCKRHIFG